MNEYLTYLPEKVVLGQLIGYLLAVVAFVLYAFTSVRWKKWLVPVAIGGVCWSAGAFTFINDFLHQWDEQFHALVAKNMMHHPFKPTLFGPDVADPMPWSSGHVWLHKQPLFLWQMALSLKLFGTSVLAARLPSIVMHGITTWLLFRMAREVMSDRFSIVVALLYGFSAYQLCVVGGMVAIDHNDVAFTCYVTASLWSLVQYLKTGKMKYAVLIGVFSGGAVLIKWLAGLLVYFVWSVCILIRKEWKQIRFLAMAVGISILLFLPWQLYCYFNYTELFLQEMSYNGAHFFRAIESHSGDYLFHWQAMRDIYGAGDIPRLLIVVGLILFFVEGFRRSQISKILLTVAYATVYLFFSIAETKMIGFTLIVSPIGILLMVYPVFRLLQYLQYRFKFSFRASGLAKWMAMAMIILVPVLHFQYKKVLESSKIKLTALNDYRTRWTNYALEQIEAGGDDVVYLIDNDDYYNVPELAFYTNATLYMSKNYAGKKPVVLIEAKSIIAGEGAFDDR